MGSMRSMQIDWDELLDAFSSDDRSIYYLDRETGEVFFVPTGYEDQEFWSEVGRYRQRYLRIPSCDYDQERYLVYQFIQQVKDSGLRTILERTFAGRSGFGRIEDILSFYPDEREELDRLREEVMTGRIRHWLEEHDLYTEMPDGLF